MDGRSTVSAGSSLLFQFQAPEVRRRRQELNSHPLASLDRIAQINYPAFLFFLRLRIGQNEHYAVVHLMLQHEQAAVGIYDHGFAELAELLPVMSAPLCLHPDPVEYAAAAAWRC